jgi:hypothetical protein
MCWFMTFPHSMAICPWAKWTHLMQCCIATTDDISRSNKHHVCWNGCGLPFSSHDKNPWKIAYVMSEGVGKVVSKPVVWYTAWLLWNYNSFQYQMLWLRSILFVWWAVGFSLQLIMLCIKLPLLRALFVVVICSFKVMDLSPNASKNPVHDHTLCGSFATSMSNTPAKSAFT